MKVETANSFPELAFIIMRDNPKKAWDIADLTEEAARLERDYFLIVNIKSGYDKYSTMWSSVMNSGLTRDSCGNSLQNEDKPTVFESMTGVCSEPWTLSEGALDGETYNEFRTRIRGTGARNRLAKPKASYDKPLKPWVDKSFDKHQTDGVAELVIQDGDNTIHVFEDVVEYRNANGQTHRIDGPALINFRHGFIEFYINGVMNKEDGPARVYREAPECDVLALKGVDETRLGEVSEDGVVGRYIGILAGRGSDKELLLRLKTNLIDGTYSGFDSYLSSWEDAQVLIGELRGVV